MDIDAIPVHHVVKMAWRYSSSGGWTHNPNEFSVDPRMSRFDEVEEWLATRGYTLSESLILSRYVTLNDTDATLFKLTFG